MSSLETTQAAVEVSPYRRDMLRLLAVLLVAIGVIISGYLSYTKLTNTAIICTEGAAFNCDAVQNSAYGQVAGIPIAYLGLATYLGLGALLLLEDRVELLRSYGAILVFGITLFGFIYSIFLVYVQAAILREFCTWCLGHEVVMTLLFILAGLRLYRSLRA